MPEVTSIEPEPPDIDAPETVQFTAKGDLTRRGEIGTATLTITDRRILYRDSSGLEQAWPISEVRRPRIETLVDASALIADVGGLSVELLRSSSKRSLMLASVEKRLRALLEGGDPPRFEEATRLCPKCGKPIPEGEECPNCVNRGQALVRLFSYTREYRFRLIWGVFLTLAMTCVQLLPPYLTKLLVDDVMRAGNRALFPKLLVALFTIGLLQMVFHIARARNVAYLGARIAIKIRTSLFEKLQSLSLSYFDRRNVGSIMSRMVQDTMALYDVLVDGLPILINQAALVIGIPIAMLLIDWKITLFALIPLPVVLIAVRWFRRKMVRIWARYWHNSARLSGALNGILQGERVVKAFHGEQREVDRFGRRIQALAMDGYKAEAHWANFFPAVLFLVSSSVFVVWWFGGNAVLDSRLQLGELVAFVAYLAMMQQPLMMLQRMIDWTTRSLTAAERVFEVMDTPVDVHEAADAQAMPRIQGHVRFNDVHFGYDKTREVLHGISLEVQPGEMVGLVGHSGAGKSTLINLLLRFYDPTHGKIEIDGVDLRKVKIADFRRQVGVVLQDSYLFPGSVRDNIAYGRPDASLEEVMAAAKAANAHEFIVNFPDGYDSYVGERGQRLSGGERQRISIARAILHNPKILVLDEATASVDTETEQLIQEALERLVDGRTTFAIAHRLSTLRNADRLFVIQDGRIAETGTHQELLEKENGIYAGLAQMQLQVNRLSESPSERDR